MEHFWCDGFMGKGRDWRNEGRFSIIGDESITFGLVGWRMRG